MKYYRVLKQELKYPVSDNAKLLHIYLLDKIIISQLPSIKLPSVRTISEKLSINKNYVSKYIHELREAGLITTKLSNGQTKVYVSVNVINPNTNEIEQITNPSIWLSRGDGNKSQYSLYPYKLVSEEFLSSDLSAGRKICYMCFKHCCENRRLQSFSAKIVCSDKTFNLNYRTVKEYISDLEKQGWINLQLVNPNIPRLGYKSITFNDTPVIKERAKLNQSQFISNEVSNTPSDPNNRSTPASLFRLV